MNQLLRTVLQSTTADMKKAGQRVLHDGFKSKKESKELMNF